MSFSLINTWSSGDKFTSAQANAIAIDLTKALDKSVAGDVLSGAIDMVATAQLAANFSGNIVSNAAGAIISEIASGIIPGTAGGISDGGVTGGILASVPLGIFAAVRNGIAAGILGGIGDGGFVGGIAPTVAGGIGDGGVTGGIASTVPSGITTGVAGGIASGVLHGIKLTGGATDEIQYGSAHTTIRRNLIWSPKPPSSWTQKDQLAVGPNTTDILFVPLLVLDDLNSSGATLTSVKVRFVVNDPHVSGPPGVMPQFGLNRALVSTGSTYLLQSLTSFTPQIPTPPNGTAWYASNHIQEYIFVPDQNNVIDRNLYMYYLSIEDENGAFSVAGNFWYSVELTLTGITTTSR